MTEDIKCGCSETWKCPEHRGAKIPVKNKPRRFGISSYMRGFLEGLGLSGIIFILLKIMEQLQK